MSGLLFSSLVGSVVGMAGTGLGAVFSFVVRGKGNTKLPSILMMFSGGIMIAVVILDLIPEAYRFSGVYSTVYGMLFGALFVIILNYLLPQPGAQPNAGSATTIRSPMVRMGILIGTGIAVHNFPEGLAIGSGLISGTRFGFDLSLLIMLHDVPEGMAMSIPLRMGGVKKSACLFYTVASGLPTAFGAFFGNLIGNISASFIGGCMAFAGGAMLYITIKELIPESLNIFNGAEAYLSIAAGLAAGALMVFII